MTTSAANAAELLADIAPAQHNISNFLDFISTSSWAGYIDQRRDPGLGLRRKSLGRVYNLEAGFPTKRETLTVPQEKPVLGGITATLFRRWPGFTLPIPVSGPEQTNQTAKFALRVQNGA
ncbi:MAG: hypothetical protein ACR2OL_15530 [Anderseniella sp.]